MIFGPSDIKCAMCQTLNSVRFVNLKNGKRSLLLVASSLLTDVLEDVLDETDVEILGEHKDRMVASRLNSWIGVSEKWGLFKCFVFSLLTSTLGMLIAAAITYKYHCFDLSKYDSKEEYISDWSLTLLGFISLFYIFLMAGYIRMKDDSLKVTVPLFLLSVISIFVGGIWYRNYIL